MLRTGPANTRPGAGPVFPTTSTVLTPCTSSGDCRAFLSAIALSSEGGDAIAAPSAACSAIAIRLGSSIHQAISWRRRTTLGPINGCPFAFTAAVRLPRLCQIRVPARSSQEALALIPLS